MSSFVDIASQAARSGGRVLLDWQGRFQAREKAPRDLVTEADFASQQEIRRVIHEAFPDHGFVGEEDDHSAPPQTGHSPYRWIVDPLDGTTNYVHGLPLYSVSVALECDGEIVAAAIYDPTRNDCYQAELGQGAFRNEELLQTSDCRHIAQAMTAASFSTHVDRQSAEMSRFFEVLQECQGVRRLGSAALNMCFVAAGRIDAYFATSVKIWDIAAGVLLVTEAGGCISQLDGTTINLEKPRFCASATADLHAEMLQTLARAEPS